MTTNEAKGKRTKFEQDLKNWDAKRKELDKEIDIGFKIIFLGLGVFVFLISIGMLIGL